MDVRWVTAFLDGPDRSAEEFWLRVTGSVLSPRRGQAGEFATLVPRDGDAYLRVQVTGSPPPGVHVDLHVDDVPGAAARAAGLGAVVLADGEDGLVVLRSPGGLVFCLVAWAGEAVRPGPYGFGLVDQVCLDLPPGVFGAEVGFWSALTGWPRLAKPLPELEVLARPDGMPLRLLLQRLDAGAAGAHLDLASVDQAAEVARHVALGAVVEYEGRGGWTTLRDPAGRRYCVTDRAVVGGSW